MAVSRVKTWAALEVLTADDLNAEFNNILNNGEDIGWPATKAKDLDGQELILDSDADTSITADTDDEIDFKVSGNDVVTITASGITINGQVVSPESLQVNVALIRSRYLQYANPLPFPSVFSEF